ncbi:MAG: hypothetical protein ACI4PF_06420 [Christensenellales bacterium]
MSIDISNYDKTKAGTYKIKFEYKGVKVDYDVDVVEKITNPTSINNRMTEVINNTFKRNNKVLSFEATKTTTMTSGDFIETLIFVDNNGQISAYTKWIFNNEDIMEIHYNGTTNTGVETCIIASEDTILEYEDFSLEEYSLHLLATAELMSLPAEITPSGILALKDEIYAGELSLNNNVYTLTNEDNELTYSNNIITKLNGAELKFPKEPTTTIPEFTSIQEYMNPVIEKTFTRNNGKLEIIASDTVELENGATITQDFIIQEDNGSYLIYNKFTASMESESLEIEMWFNGTLDNGEITINDGTEITSYPEFTLEDFELIISGFQEGLNEEGIDYTVYLYPSDLINLETAEFYGELTVLDEGMGSLTQEYLDGITLTLIYVDNEIVDVNGVTVAFSDTITPTLIPTIPEVTDASV